MRQNEERGTEVIVPHLAESLVSAIIGKWLKQPGDYVREYEGLCELLTDKVNVEMPSPLEGKLVHIIVQEGESADVGAPICIIRGGDELRAGDSDVPVGVESKETASGEHSSRYSPAVLRLAKEHGTDLHKVKGTGLGGRITRKDILTHVKNLADLHPQTFPVRPAEKQEVTSTKNEPTVTPAKASEQRSPIPEVRNLTNTVHPVTPMRKLIASRMQQSVTEIPHAWLMVEADVSRLVALRQRLKTRFQSEEGVQLTFTPFVVKAIVNAIKDFPVLNSTWASENMIIKKEIHLSIAIGSENSVVTPVIRNADHKTIAGLAIELDALVKRARAGTLTLADMHGGTFTFNNTGAFGSILSYPIINYPQAAIITFESIVRKPVVIQDDAIAVRSMVNLCLSLDHRILDGVICGQFMQRVKQNLELYDPDTIIY
ncbi:dihydrolipoamide acetyltransferase family protein [Paenibacillus sedimenti]|uniref:Dihydrolipoamide acetyltransferase component of pyruvate dehydrogenase complex n=1 Tax=Paenibacillus sedimenti TaxID=2770274 RepID=A0A926KNW8_9BACL|nr:dihydrolipoamide acetyltransferase family protein [Paenibacillus sedimenti]MBD0380211.1 2-oxo acid dehydrogenase subunit E2 [Paenibacillus sedimenti]